MGNTKLICSVNDNEYFRKWVDDKIALEPRFDEYNKWVEQVEADMDAKKKVLLGEQEQLWKELFEEMQHQGKIPKDAHADHTEFDFNREDGTLFASTCDVDEHGICVNEKDFMKTIEEQLPPGMPKEIRDIIIKKIKDGEIKPGQNGVGVATLNTKTGEADLKMISEESRVVRALKAISKDESEK